MSDANQENEIQADSIVQELKSIILDSKMDEILKNRLIMTILAEYGTALSITHLKNLYEQVAPYKSQLKFIYDNENKENL